MSVLYGKIRIYGDAGQTITITDGKGNTKTVQTTGQEFTDIALPGMEEYILSNPANSVDTILNIGDFKEVTLPAYIPTLEDLTWAQVQSIIQNGTFGDRYSVGDTKSFVINNKIYHAEVVAINDGTGNASQWYPANTVDFICKELYETAYRYNATNTNAGGFPSSEVKTTLNSTIYPLLPTDLKDVIIEKSHSYQAGSYSSSWSSSMTTLATKLWLPTYYEIAGTTETYAVGETASNNKAYTLTSKVKNLNGQTSATNWWLGSPISSDSSTFWRVDTFGGLNFSGASYTRGVPVCFRIGQGGDN